MADPWTILIVDDSEDDRDDVRRLLLRSLDRRYRFVEAQTVAAGASACERLRSSGSGPDVVIVDYNLPDGTALDFLCEVATDGGLPHCPVVVLTGSVAPCVGARVLQAGAQDFMAKSDLSAGYLTRAIENAAERYRLQQALRESEARFRRMADQTPIILWVHDVSGGVEFVNEEFCRFFRVSLDTVRGQLWHTLVHPDDRAYVEALKHATLARTPFQAHARLRRGDGQWRWIASHAIPRLDRSGEFLGMIGVCIDITDQRAANDLQRESAREKDEFIAVLAHELRNPLAPIRTAAGILRVRGPLDPVLERCRTIIDRQLGHMARLLDDLLDVSRLSRGKLTLQPQPVPLCDVIDAALEIAQPVVEERQHTVTVDAIDPQIVLVIDATRLAQVFANLLNNAAKYTPLGGKIGVSVHRESHCVKVIVHDTGIGIEPGQQARIFNMFTQLGGASAHSEGGLGIGLGLTKQLVEMHGGSIAVASAGRHQGSAFTVTLPMESRADVVAGEPVPPAHPVAQPFDAPRRRVLIVDDNRDAADSLGLLLEAMACDVRTVYDGEGAIEQARLFEPDLVLLDLGMPGLNGQAVCRGLRRESWGARAVIAAVTGWGQDSDRWGTQAAGFDHHFVKPVDLDRLVALVRGLPQQGHEVAHSGATRPDPSWSGKTGKE